MLEPFGSVPASLHVSLVTEERENPPCISVPAFSLGPSLTPSKPRNGKGREPPLYMRGSRLKGEGPDPSGSVNMGGSSGYGREQWKGVGADPSECGREQTERRVRVRGRLRVES